LQELPPSYYPPQVHPSYSSGIIILKQAKTLFKWRHFEPTLILIPAAKRFFKKMMRADHKRLPFTISVDKNAAYPEAFTTSQTEKVLPHDCKLRRVKYLNNIIEQDHRFIMKRVRACLGYRSFDTAERTLQGIEAMHMIRKGQVKRLGGRDAIGQAKFVASLFQIAA
jgi:transposase, IS6 family